MKNRDLLAHVERHLPGRLMPEDAEIRLVASDQTIGTDRMDGQLWLSVDVLATGPDGQVLFDPFTSHALVERRVIPADFELSEFDA